MKRLADRDTGDHVFLLSLAVRLGPVIMLFLLAVEWAFYRERMLWLLIPDIAATALIVLGAYKVFGGVSRAAGSILFPASGGPATARQYSEQAALVIRGRYAEAADSYSAIIEDEPRNIDVHLLLGALYQNECNDPVSAERCFRAIRALRPTSEQDWVSSNALIDLYEREGNHERLKAELSGLSRRFAHTSAGEAARRRLRELAGEDATPPPASSA